MMFGRGYNGFTGCFGPGFAYGGWGTMIFMAVLILLAVAVIVYIARKPRYRHTDDGSLQELKMRLVRGEISEEEYLRKKNIIG